MADHLTPPGYMPRVADGEVERSLRASSAVVIEGPRACGKTWTGRRFARSEVPFDAVFENRLAAQVSPRELLDVTTQDVVPTASIWGDRVWVIS